MHDTGFGFIKPLLHLFVILIKYNVMKAVLVSLVFIFAVSWGKAQLYFPPANSGTWETTAPASLGWCPQRIDSLYSLLDRNNTKSFILLKDGKIVLEKYFNGHTPTSMWYWASAGKSLTAVLVGLAQQNALLSLEDKTSKYLGNGWTNCTMAQEDMITIRHQLTMSSGLNDAVADPYCTLPSCLTYKADPGTRWAYHNGPYTLLDSVMTKATGQTLNAFANQKLKTKTGIDGLFIRQGYNNVFFSTARSMARFGLFILNNGNWNGNQILTDTAYFRSMVNTSQNLNKSYGYLWWLNGKASFMLPQTQLVFAGSMNPQAPDDMVAAMGKDGQFVNVIPSQNMVWIRMGNAPDESPVPFLFNDKIWEYINALDCSTVGTSALTDPKSQVVINPNPAGDVICAALPDEIRGAVRYQVLGMDGKVVLSGKAEAPEICISTDTLPAGIYILRVVNGSRLLSSRFYKN